LIGQPKKPTKLCYSLQLLLLLQFWYSYILLAFIQLSAPALFYSSLPFLGEGKVKVELLLLLLLLLLLTIAAAV
jgi:hypothetical protein